MRSFVLMLLFGLAGPAAPAPVGAHTGGRVGGFENPESAAWDGPTGSFYISSP